MTRTCAADLSRFAPSRWSGRVSVLVLLSSIAVAQLATAGEPSLPSWQRGEIVALPADACRELRIDRVGRGPLELRFATELLPTPSGPDLKSTGASVLIAAEDPERVTFQVYTPGGIFGRSSRVPAPLRWLRHGATLCVASGSRVVSCAPVAGEIAGTVLVPFGPGWQADVAGCAAFPIRDTASRSSLAWLAGFAALAAFAMRTSRRRVEVFAVAVCAASLACAAIAVTNPWRLPTLALLPGGAIASLLAAAAAQRGRRRPWVERAPWIALGLLTASAIGQVRYPVWSSAPVDPLVPSLWRDSADWHPRAAHQSLEFRGRPVAGVAPDAEQWLVLGGSVVFGEGVDASQTFTAIAQDLLRKDGDANVLNAGAQGWNIGNIDRLLADGLDSLPVTGIVIVSILNNATLPIAAAEPAGCDASLPIAYLCNVSRNQLVLAWPKVFLPKPGNLARYRSTLRALLARELALGRKVVLLDEIGEIDDRRWLWSTEAYRTVAREVAAEAGVPFHGVRDAIAPLAENERFLDGIHPTPAMHLLLGRRLYEVLREQRSAAISR